MWTWVKGKRLKIPLRKRISRNWEKWSWSKKWLFVGADEAQAELKEMKKFLKSAKFSLPKTQNFLKQGLEITKAWNSNSYTKLPAKPTPTQTSTLNVTTLHKTGKILGGYADQIWDGYSLAKASRKVFIFDLNTKKQYVPSQMNLYDFSMYCDNTSGPGFGSYGSSFGIRENPALNSSISSTVWRWLQWRQEMRNIHFPLILTLLRKVWKQVQFVSAWHFQMCNEKLEMSNMLKCISWSILE